MKTLIYCRVSRKDQDYERQISDLKAVAALRHWEVLEVVTEKASGAKIKRNGTDKLLEFAEKGAIQKLMVTEVSRLGRNTLQVLQIIERLTTLNVSVYIHNFGIETLQANGKKNPMVSMMLTILAEFATMERENLIDRTRSGLAHAKRNGTVLGRPHGTTKSKETLLAENPQAVKLFKKKIYSIRQVAKLAEISINTSMKIKHAM